MKFIECINKNRVFLVENIFPRKSLLWDYLIKEQIVSQGNAAYIQQKHETDRDQVREILNIISCRTEEDFKKFVKILHETGHTTAAGKLVAGEHSLQYKQENLTPVSSKRSKLEDKLLLEYKVKLLELNKGFLISKTRNNAELQQFGRSLLFEREKGVISMQEIVSALHTTAEYDEFCRILCETGQSVIVREYLTTEEDFESAKAKLVEYYLGEFSDISVYSKHHEYSKVANKDLFVPMTWGQYKDKRFREISKLSSYKEMFQKIRNQSSKHESFTRILVEGEPGTGKTTFVKRLCYLWAKSKENGTDNDIGEVLEYDFIIPIILRMVKIHQKLVDIILDQFDFLSVTESIAISQNPTSTSKKMLYLLDGFDEMKENSVHMRNIISKQDLTNVICITTYRTYAVNLIYQLSRHAVHQHFRMEGFNDEQILLYFRKFCECYGIDVNSAEKLYIILQKERPDLFELAHVPIRCEIIAVVWNAYGHLGKSVSDLYIMFVSHLLIHHKTKHGFTQQTTDTDVLKENHELLMTIGELANAWTRSGSLQIVFTTENLQAVFGHEGLLKAAEIGILTKSHPASHIDKTMWSFPHLTLQEFFVAFYLANCDERKRAEFIMKCHNMKLLQKTEVVFQFLVSQYPDVANDIIGNIIRFERTKEQNIQLLSFILRIFPYFHSKMHIPLPQYVHTDVSKVHEKHMLHWISMDTTVHPPNLQSLRVHEREHYCNVIGQDYVKEIQIKVGEYGIQGCCLNKLNRMNSIRKLIIDDEKSYIKDHSIILNQVPTDRLECLEICSNNTAVKFGNFMQSAKHLQEVCIIDKFFNTKCLQESEAKLAKISIRSALQSGMLAIKAESVILVVSEVTLGQLTENLNEIKQSPADCNVIQLNISSSKLGDSGDLLGEMISHMPSLKYLSMDNCGLNKETIRRISQKISGTNCPITDLLLQGNDLIGSGYYLGNFISLMICLNYIEIVKCNITADDVAAMATCIPATNTIQNLNIWEDNLSDKAEDADKVANLLQIMPNLHFCCVSGEAYSDPIPAVCKALCHGALTNLRILLTCGQLKPGNIKLLGKNLPKLFHLECLDMSFIEGVDLDEYQSVYENLQSSIKHLSLFNEKIHIDPYVILENKHKFSGVERLNVLLEDTEIEMLQEQLEDVSPDILVYSDGNELPIHMYSYCVCNRVPKLIRNAHCS